MLLARLRKGRANTARGAAHFRRETVRRVGYARATGQLTVRADSGFYNHAIVAVCRKAKVCYSITVRQHPSLRNVIEAIPEEEWRPVPYWMEGAADVAETEYTPFQHEPDATAVWLIVRRVKPTPGSQLVLFTTYSYHAFITGRDGDTLEPEADNRRHTEVENAIRDLKYGVGLNHLPSGRFAANPELAEGGLAGHPGDGPQPGPLGSAHRAGRATGYHQDPQTTLLLYGQTSMARRLTRSARRLTLHLPQGWPWAEQATLALARLRAIPLPALRRYPQPPQRLQTRVRPVRECILRRPVSNITRFPGSIDLSRGPVGY